MKFLLSILALVVAVVQAEVDWSQVKRKEIDPITRKIVDVPYSPRIVGGEEATPNEFPYQAALLISTPAGTYFCGGSLISTNYVLTAAHCVEDATSIEVILGAHNIRETESTQQRFVSSTFKYHAAWSSSTLQNDIAVITLPTPAVLNSAVQLIPLPSYSDASNTFAGSSSTVSGWGRPSDSSSSISDVLRYVQVNVITNLLCNISFLGVIQSSNICTSGSDGRSTCSGDSGGPLVVGNRQVGIVSFGIALGCELGWPAAYARVTSYLDWLATNTDAVISS